MFKTTLLAAIGAAALALPGLASAQPFAYGHAYFVQYGDRPYGYDRPGEERPYGGDYFGRERNGGVYPEFRGIEAHIRREIIEGVRQDLIERDDARDLMGQLRDIQNREMREFRVHGWNLPDDDRMRIRSDLDRLDRLVDQIREED